MGRAEEKAPAGTGPQRVRRKPYLLWFVGLLPALYLVPGNVEGQRNGTQETLAQSNTQGVVRASEKG